MMVDALTSNSKVRWDFFYVIWFKKYYSPVAQQMSPNFSVRANTYRDQACLDWEAKFLQFVNNNIVRYERWNVRKENTLKFSKVRSHFNFFPLTSIRFFPSLVNSSTIVAFLTKKLNLFCVILEAAITFSGCVFFPIADKQLSIMAPSMTSNTMPWHLVGNCKLLASFENSCGVFFGKDILSLYSKLADTRLRLLNWFLLNIS